MDEEDFAKQIGSNETGIYRRWSARLAAKYGRKQGWIRYHRYRMAYQLGWYAAFSRVYWSQVTNLVFVCRGNISRSPYAEARARVLGFPATSYGLQANNAHPFDPIAQKVAEQLGIDMKRHRARLLERETFGSGMLLLAMEPWQGARLQEFIRGTKAQVTLLGIWHTQPHPHIEDPWGLGEEYYRTCYMSIDSSVERVLSKIKTALPSEAKSCKGSSTFRFP